MILFWRKKPWVDLQHEEEYIPKDYKDLLCHGVHGPEHQYGVAGEASGGV